MTPKSPLPSDSASRKEIPLSEGVLGYCPAALVAVAKASQAGNSKHLPGEPLLHDRSKSMDHPDCLLRHLVDYQAIKAAAMRAGSWSASNNADAAEEHLGNMAWRAMMYVQQELEAMGRAPLAPNAKPAPVAEQPAQKGSPIAEQSVPGIYDPATRQWVSHPAQLMAIEAFKKAHKCLTCGLLQSQEPSVTCHSDYYCNDCYGRLSPL